MVLFQIKAPYFCAGGEIKNRIVIFAAPIIKFMVGWNVEKVFDYCKKKEWDVKSYATE